MPQSNGLKPPIAVPARSASKQLPSKRWASFDSWDYNGMKERLQATIEKIDKSVITRHAERIKGQKVTMSEPFSAGQYWICFELVSEDGSLIVARVGLPRHPDSAVSRSEDDERYAIACEINTMEFVRPRLPNFPVPLVYAHEGPGSRLAADAGAVYMLLEGFYGNTLQDIEPDISELPMEKQEHIMAQWTKVQTELATLAYPQIGSICSVSQTGEPIFGRLADASAVGLENAGPFSRATEYFTAVAHAAIERLDPSAKLGAFVFLDIVRETTLFGDEDTNELFPLNHMDLGTQNILVDDDFNFIAIIDWEFAQTAPWQVNHYPMPFPLLGSDIEDLLKDPGHVAYPNVSRQHRSREVYLKKFQEAESRLEAEGQLLRGSFAKTLKHPASRIYACFTNLGRMPSMDGDLVRDMARFAFELDGDQVEEYIKSVAARAETDNLLRHSPR